VGSNARLDVVAAGGGRVAVERAEGTVELLDPTGRTLRRFPFRLGELGAVALTSNALVVQHTGPDAKLDRLAVYDAATGKLAHDWPIAAGLRVADAGAGYAALAGSRTLSVLRLTDGRTAAIGVGSGAIFAQLVPHGLFFAYASPASALKGRVGFLPLARLATKF
jgi:hypothetical protein